MNQATDVNFKKISAQETDYGTGAHRDTRAGKGAFHWMPWDAVFLVSRIYELGNKGRSNRPNKDGRDRNWENGMPIDELIQSAINHYTAYLDGDRSEAHLSQACWNGLNALAMSIWVYMGWRPKSLAEGLANHRAAWKPGDEPPCPLSPQEIEWLKVRNIVKKEEPVFMPVPDTHSCPDGDHQICTDRAVATLAGAKL